MKIKDGKIKEILLLFKLNETSLIFICLLCIVMFSITTLLKSSQIEEYKNTIKTNKIQLQSIKKELNTTKKQNKNLKEKNSQLEIDLKESESK